jgi:hypothetical protein
VAARKHSDAEGCGGEVAPALQRGVVDRVIGPAKNSDGAWQAGSRSRPNTFGERKVCSQGRQDCGHQFASVHHDGGRTAVPDQRGHKILVR